MNSLPKVFSALSVLIAIASAFLLGHIALDVELPMELFTSSWDKLMPMAMALLLEVTYAYIVVLLLCFIFSKNKETRQ